MRIALSYYTRLPVGHPVEFDAAEWRDSLGYLPWCGLLSGLLGGGTLLLSTLAFSSTLSALLALVAMMLFTGALHEDGLADTFDGFGGGRDKASILKIMKDPQLGSFGAIALMASLALRTLLISGFSNDQAVVAILFSQVASRSLLLLPVYLLPYARPDGGKAGVMTERQSLRSILPVALLLFPMLAWFGWLEAVRMVFIILLIALAYTGTLKKKIGGYTGDTLGALQQLGEIAILMLLTIAPVAPGTAEWISF